MILKEAARSSEMLIVFLFFDMALYPDGTMIQN
jgi:hypothetical protein